MRVTTAFNRLLALQGARVIDVLFGYDGVTVRVALRRRRAVCSACGQLCRQVHDRAFRRWRHLDLGGNRCHIEYELRRVRCLDCGVRVEAVPWARPGARHTRDFEDLVAFCAQQMAKTPITALLRVGWETVGRIVERVVADNLDTDRLKRLVMIGVDEISYRRGQRYLTQVCDHQTGAIVWAKPGRNAATLQDFFDDLGPDGRASIKAISIDMNGGYEKAIRDQQAADPGFEPEVCFDPFHVCQLAGRAVDDVRRAEWNTQGKSRTGHGRWVKSVRWSLLKAPERQTVRQLAALHEVEHANRRLYRAFLLKEELRLLYHLDDPQLAATGPGPHPCAASPSALASPASTCASSQSGSAPRRSSRVRRSIVATWVTLATESRCKPPRSAGTATLPGSAASCVVLVSTTTVTVRRSERLY